MPSLCNFHQLTFVNFTVFRTVQQGILFAVGQRTEATPLLTSLHWLTVSKCITFKLLLYVFKSLQHQPPSYLSDCFQKYVPARHLRSSSDSTCLVILKPSKTVFGEKRFHIAAAKAWNELPGTIRSASSIEKFNRMLKSHLF
ncbi:hypothetical protein HOLleu_27227 [Holothuria leucospilota]|uniref:Uncharacterized protein n=1 Tax=Holothuria leucospilota TaxID=206669 RepID=A0A9Q1BQJ0_HOLLE|nr:hypothetical protein HOLleu_27227 [Holothuria leucospilota]